MYDMTTQDTHELQKQLDRTKGQLFFKKSAGFLGRLMTKVDFRWTNEIPTAAISPKMLYWNPDFFHSLDEESRVTVLAHELLHNGFLHGVRLGNRCPDVWNIAADHVIILYLAKHGFYMRGFPYIMDHKYDGWATEDVYDDLDKNGGGGQPSSSPLSGDIMPTPDGADTAQAIADVVAARISSKMGGGSSLGDIPGEIEMIIEEFLQPKLPWEQLLQNFFTEMTNEEYSYQRPNRRYDDPILPGKTGRNGLEHLIYYLDISGSISDDQVIRFNSEVKSVKDDLRPELLTLVTFDTEIHDECVFEKDDPFEKIVVTGRGGTDLEDVYRHAKEHAPSAMIIFTDLEVSIPADPGIPILWICVGQHKHEVPYGTLIHLPT